jgi:hypothetical protein
VKDTFSRGEGFCKTKTSDWRFSRIAKAVLGKYRLKKKAKQGLGKRKRVKTCKCCQCCFRYA